MYASKIGIKVTMPKWGYSKSDYSYDEENHTIAKGLASIKYMGSGVGERLYEIAHKQTYTRFIDVLLALKNESCVNSKQIDILIKIDFFSEFGNQRELLRIVELFDKLFDRGDAKKIKRELVDSTPIGKIVEKYSTGVTKSGSLAKSYTLLDIVSIMQEVEDSIKQIHMDDLSDTIKVRNFADAMGYAGYISNKEEDRRKLYIADVFPLVRKKDGKQFGYSIVTKSIGSGKESRFTVFNSLYNKDPIKPGDIVYCSNFVREGQYFKLTGYSKVF